MEKIEYRYRFWYRYRPKFMVSVSVSVSTKKASIAHHYFIIATNDARANSVLRFEHEHAHN